MHTKGHDELFPGIVPEPFSVAFPTPLQARHVGLAVYPALVFVQANEMYSPLAQLVWHRLQFFSDTFMK